MTMVFPRPLASETAAADLTTAHPEETSWHPQIGDIFPDFSAASTQGTFRFHDWARGAWVYFFSHPAAFTPICTTEMAHLAEHAAAFEKRGIKLLTLSVDSTEDQLRWVREIEESFGTRIGFPVISDPDRRLATACGMIHPKDGGDRPIRRSFFVDPEGRIRMILDYPTSIGRSTDEILRVFDALRATDDYQLGAPADWHDGDSFVVLAGETDREAEHRLHTKLVSLMRYLRTVAPGHSDEQEV